MNAELLQDMYYAAPEFWFGLALIGIVLICGVLFLSFRVLKLKQRNYFLRRDRERYAETLYASHDGYFAFIYPDDKINDPRDGVIERCSRRLAVILGLEKGVRSCFDDVLKNFYKDDEKKICKYTDLLREEGVAFEDYFLLKSAEKYIRLEGVRINGSDGSIYCDMIWFRDVSFATRRIKELEESKKETDKAYLLQQDLLDNLPFAVWLRNDALDIVYCNKKFAEFIPGKSREEIVNNHLEPMGANGEGITKGLAVKAHNSNRLARSQVSLVVDGNRVALDAFEAPFYAEQNFEKTYSAGLLSDISELDELRRNLSRYQDAQLEILGMLGTAFAVFNQNTGLSFYNKAFATLWNLDAEWLNAQPNYAVLLDNLREKRLLPEVPDYKSFRKDELRKFNAIMEPTSDLMHLPNGKTLRRMCAPYPMGGVVFAYEDISDRLAATSAYNALLSVQNEILNNLTDAVLIFGSNNRLSFFNSAYVRLWSIDENFLRTEPSFDELLDSQQKFFADETDWDSLKQGISANILNMTSKTLSLKRNDGQTLELNVANLSDGSLMLTYRIVDIAADL